MQRQRCSSTSKCVAHRRWAFQSPSRAMTCSHHQLWQNEARLLTGYPGVACRRAGEVPEQRVDVGGTRLQGDHAGPDRMIFIRELFDTQCWLRRWMWGKGASRGEVPRSAACTSGIVEHFACSKGCEDRGSRMMKREDEYLIPIDFRFSGMAGRIDAQNRRVRGSRGTALDQRRPIQHMRS